MEEFEDHDPAVNDICQHCGGDNPQAMHECPFGYEMNNCTDLCNCCRRCETQCALDI